MKEALALAAFMAATGAACAQSSVTVYGLVDLSVGRSQASAGTTGLGGTGTVTPAQTINREDSGVGFGSRLGFRGTEDLGGGLSARFALEMGLAADTGGLNQGGLAFGRQSYVGLWGNGWSVSLGRQYTPILLSMAATEPVAGGSWGNMTNQMIGVYEQSGSTPGNGSFQLVGRADNSVAVSGYFGPVTVNTMVSAGNENTRGTGRFLNAGITYAEGPVRLDASVARMRQNAEQIVATASPEWLKMTLLGGSYDLKFAKLYAGYYRLDGPQNAANLSAAGAATFKWNKLTAGWLGAKIPVGSLSVINAQIGKETFNYPGAPDGKATVLALNYEYSLSKRTTAYVSYGKVLNNDRSNAGLYGSIPLAAATGYNSDPSASSVGLRHAF
ncbi:MAG: porin [Rubrivivax sp.]|nr:porin [Rubrivivax sp.]